MITNPTIGTLGNQTGVSFLGKFIPAAIGLTFVAGSVIFFFMLVTGAIQWISSGGDKGGLEAAKGKLTNALIGIFILFGSFAIIRLVQTFFGIHILTIDIGPLIIR